MKVPICATAIFACGLLGAFALQPSAQEVANDAQQRLQALEAGGTATPLTLYPVRVLGRPDRNVADALGLLLEKRGMQNLEAVDAAFTPTDGQTWDEVARHFSEFVRQNPPATTYALYAEYLGEPKGGPTEVRWVVVDRTGQLMLVDRQTPEDKDFRRTAARDPDPMGCSVLVVERLFSRLHWASRPAPSPGKFAQLWEAKSGTPGEAERLAIRQRAEKFKSDLKSAHLEVYATLVGSEPNAESAARLAKMLSQRFGCSATTCDKAAPIKIAPTSNEQKRLWDLARGFRNHLRANPPTTEYALLAEFLIPPGGPAHSVHVVVCDRAGEWVVVDFQNNLHDDYRRIQPAGVEDCERLAVERVARRVE